MSFPGRKFFVRYLVVTLDAGLFVLFGKVSSVTFGAGHPARRMCRTGKAGLDRVVTSLAGRLFQFIGMGEILYVFVTVKTGELSVPGCFVSAVTFKAC